ncbi:MAG: hypothetical protein J4F41_00805 [Alphaproteobacteria bacterium]|nr:hypothetical protein [Alphaproteobacteria bacterium]
MSLLKSIVALALAVALAGCANTSRISDDIHAEMGKIMVVTEKGRAEQLFRQEFERLVARHGISDAQYRLETTIASTRGDNNMVMRVQYSLYDRENGTVLTSKTFSSSASIGGVSSTFGSDQATIHARERLSMNLAQKIYNHLILFFTQAKSNS